MKAQEARKIAEQTVKQIPEDEYQNVMEMVKEKINHQDLDVDHFQLSYYESLSEETIERLKADGYKIERVKSKPSYYDITW